MNTQRKPPNNILVLVHMGSANPLAVGLQATYVTLGQKMCLCFANTLGLHVKLNLNVANRLIWLKKFHSGPVLKLYQAYWLQNNDL